MKKVLSIVLLTLAVLFISQVKCFAESQTVRLGDTGITFMVDSSFEIITNTNKKEYSQDIQNSISKDNEMLVYSPTKGAFSVSYDQGKNLEKYSLSNKKSDEIEENYLEYVGGESFDNSVGEYDISVYDSGTYKWIKIDFKSISLVSYATIQGNSSVTTVFNPIGYNQKEIESIIDSFNFGSPSLWRHDKKE